jgi:methylated-DNA-[protein]-cysteine S-methyltransferase
MLNNSSTTTKPKSSTPFAEKCYKLLIQIPNGKVTTYQELAHALGTKAYRAVGQAMNKNPNAPKVPCHRVVSSNGTLNGYAFGVNKKSQLLKSEGLVIKNGKIMNFEQVLFRYPKKMRSQLTKSH